MEAQTEEGLIRMQKFKLQQYVNKAYRTIEEGSLEHVTFKLSRRKGSAGTYRVLNPAGKPMIKRKYA